MLRPHTRGHRAGSLRRGRCPPSGHGAPTPPGRRDPEESGGRPCDRQRPPGARVPRLLWGSFAQGGPVGRPVFTHKQPPPAQHRVAPCWRRMQGRGLGVWEERAGRTRGARRTCSRRWPCSRGQRHAAGSSRSRTLPGRGQVTGAAGVGVAHGKGAPRPGNRSATLGPRHGAHVTKGREGRAGRGGRCEAEAGAPADPAWARLTAGPGGGQQPRGEAAAPSGISPFKRVLQGEGRGTESQKYR